MLSGFFKRFAGVLTTNELRIESMETERYNLPFFSVNIVQPGGSERLMSFICVPDCEPI